MLNQLGERLYTIKSQKKGLEKKWHDSKWTKEKRMIMDYFMQQHADSGNGDIM